MRGRNKLFNKVIQWLEKWQPNETLVLYVIAILVGLTGGIGVWVFKRLIDLFNRAAVGGLGAALSPLGWWSAAILPALGGLVVGLLVHFLVGEERHHGVAGIMESVALAGGRLRYKRIPAKSVAAALGIGFGASVGPEDPSVQIGANLGSMFGQWLHMSDERVRALVASGSAAGIAAAFNAPIAGVFFALEIILGEISGSALGTVVVAAVVSAVFTQAVSGTQPAFHVPSYAFQTPWELPLYLGLGLLAGPVAALYVRLLYLAQDIFNAWPIPRWIKPAIAGLIIGIVGLFLPQVLGVGYNTIGRILAGENLAIGLMLALLVAKIILTPVSIGGGFLGGVFAPSLYLGAALGAAYGLVIQRIFPTMGLNPGAVAMVGMAAVLAGAVHSPLTAIILLFEMTNDYHIILPLMFAVVVSLLTSQFLQRDSIYTLGLARKGIRLERGRDVEVLQAITVGDVMQKGVRTLCETDSLAQAADELMKSRHHGLPVVNPEGELTGILTVQDIDRAHTEGDSAQTVGDACARDLVVAYLDETINMVLRRMSARDLGRLPVVERENPKRLLGVLRRSDIIRAYDVALARRAALRHQAQKVRLGALRGDEVSVTELMVEPGAPCDGQLMKNIAWPHACVIASLRRGGRLVIPRGDTVLQAGDVLVAVVDESAREAARRLCCRAEGEPKG